MMLRLDREDSQGGHTFGDIYVNGEYECCTLEDRVREVPGLPVADWKVAALTAIPASHAATYDVTLEDSDRFGPETITLYPVPGFTSIRIHGGTDIDDTEGCPLVGSTQDRIRMTIRGAQFDRVLEKLKNKVRPALARGERVRIQVRNGPGWYQHHRLQMPEALNA